MRPLLTSGPELTHVTPRGLLRGKHYAQPSSTRTLPAPSRGASLSNTQTGRLGTVPPETTAAPPLPASCWLACGMQTHVYTTVSNSAESQLLQLNNTLFLTVKTASPCDTPL